MYLSKKYIMLQKQIEHVLHIKRNIFLQVQKNILQVQKTVRKYKKKTRAHHTYTNASELSNKCPVIHTPQQQVALLRQFKAGRMIFVHPNFHLLFFYFIQGSNRIYHRHIHIDASLSAGPYTDITIILEKEAPPGELSCIITVTALQTFAAVNSCKNIIIIHPVVWCRPEY